MVCVRSRRVHRACGKRFLGVADKLAMMAETGVSIAYRAKPVTRGKADYALNCCGVDGVLNLFA